MYKKSLAVATSLLILHAVGWAQKNPRLSQSQVIKKAEQFVMEQGYTDLPPTEDKLRLRLEPVYGGTDDAALALRRNTLERLAFGVLKEKGRDGRWVVVFRYTAERNTPWARAVSVNPFGKDVRISHQDFNLEFPKLKKIDR